MRMQKDKGINTVAVRTSRHGLAGDGQENARFIISF
jgi:hypothetical protein